MSELTPEQRAALANGRTRPMHSLEDEAIVKRLLAQINAASYQPYENPFADTLPAQTIADAAKAKALAETEATLAPQDYAEFVSANTDAGRDRERNAQSARRYLESRQNREPEPFTIRVRRDQFWEDVFQWVFTGLCVLLGIGGIAVAMYGIFGGR